MNFSHTDFQAVRADFHDSYMEHDYYDGGREER